MCEFTYKQVDDLNCWRKLSKNILGLYNALGRDELLYGRESAEYQKRKEYIEACLEIESDIEKRFLSNDALYQSALDYINDSSLGFNRIFSRKCNSVCAFGNRIFDSDNFESTCRDVESIIFSNLKDKSMIEFIDDELQHETDYNKRDLLIYSKNYILAHNRSLECWYLMGEKDRDFSLMADDELTARMLGIPLEQYRKDIKNLINNDIRGHIAEYLERLLNGFDPEIESFEMEVKSLARLLNVDEIEILQSEIRNSYDERTSLSENSPILSVLNMLNSCLVNKDKQKSLNKKGQTN